jgi:serine/threonine protein kinase
MLRNHSAFELNSIIGNKYRIIKPIGKGGMSEVYEACHIEIDRPVAIKTLLPEKAHQETAISRFYREARLAGSVGHDHICPVTDIGLHNDVPYLVMPLLQGDTLAWHLESGRLTVSRLLDILSQVLSALSAAHQQKIIHRDLKPHNIFITEVGKQSDFVKLLDFGISKKLNADTTGQITCRGAIPGTIHYMSPEQAMGAREIDHRIDIYAVGVILYRGIIGRLPFDGSTGNEILYRISSAAFVPPRRINPNIPKALERVILKAMARDPLKRYQDADQMRLALETVHLENYKPTVTSRRFDRNVSLNGEAQHSWTVSDTKQEIQCTLPQRKRFSGGVRAILLSGIVLVLIIVASGYSVYNNAIPNESAAVSETSSVSAHAPRFKNSLDSSDSRVCEIKSDAPVLQLLSESGCGVFDEGKREEFSNHWASEAENENIPLRKAPHNVKLQMTPVSNYPKTKSRNKKMNLDNFRHQKKVIKPEKSSSIDDNANQIAGPLGTEISLEYDNYL